MWNITGLWRRHQVAKIKGRENCGVRWVIRSHLLEVIWELREKQRRKNFFPLTTDALDWRPSQRKQQYRNVQKFTKAGFYKKKKKIKGYDIGENHTITLKSLRSSDNTFYVNTKFLWSVFFQIVVFINFISLDVLEILNVLNFFLFPRWQFIIFFSF